MHQIRLIRSRGVWDTENIYLDRTDVMVFADAEGYRHMAAGVLEAKKGAVHLDTARDQYSMRCVILPPDDTVTDPRIKFLERIVFDDQAPEMELMIFGNSAGLEWLSDLLYDFIERHKGVEDDMHLDDHDGFEVNQIKPGSISLNLRGVVPEWTKEGLEPWWGMLNERPQNYLPDCIAAQHEPYKLPRMGVRPGVCYRPFCWT